VRTSGGVSRPDTAHRRGLEVSVVQHDMGVLQRLAAPFINFEGGCIPIPIPEPGRLAAPARIASRGTPRSAAVATSTSTNRRPATPLRSLEECPIDDEDVIRTRSTCRRIDRQIRREVENGGAIGQGLAGAQRAKSRRRMAPKFAGVE
jgi:hypothetical protein